jgi:hypothetical protein
MFSPNRAFSSPICVLVLFGSDATPSVIKITLVGTPRLRQPVTDSGVTNSISFAVFRARLVAVAPFCWIGWIARIAACTSARFNMSLKSKSICAAVSKLMAATRELYCGSDPTATGRCPTSRAEKSSINPSSLLSTDPDVSRASKMSFAT